MEMIEPNVQIMSEKITHGENFKIGIDYDFLLEHIDGSNYNTNCLEWLEILRTVTALYNNIKIDVLCYDEWIFIAKKTNISNNVERYGLLVDNVVRIAIFHEKENADLIINKDTYNLNLLKEYFNALIKPQAWFSLPATKKQISYIKGLYECDDPIFAQCISYCINKIRNTDEHKWLSKKDFNEMLKKATRLDARILITFWKIKIKRDKVRYFLEREREKEEKEKRIVAHRKRVGCRGYGGIDDCDWYGISEDTFF